MHCLLWCSFGVVGKLLGEPDFFGIAFSRQQRRTVEGGAEECIVDVEKQEVDEGVDSLPGRRGWRPRSPQQSHDLARGAQRPRPRLASQLAEKEPELVSQLQTAKFLNFFFFFLSFSLFKQNGPATAAPFQEGRSSIFEYEISTMFFVKS